MINFYQAIRPLRWLNSLKEDETNKLKMVHLQYKQKSQNVNVGWVFAQLLKPLDLKTSRVYTQSFT